MEICFVLKPKGALHPFKIDLIVWKYNEEKKCNNVSVLFKIDLIVWKWCNEWFRHQIM